MARIQRNTQWVWSKICEPGVRTGVRRVRKSLEVLVGIGVGSNVDESLLGSVPRSIETKVWSRLKASARTDMTTVARSDVQSKFRI